MRYIRYNKNLGLVYYVNRYYAPLSDLLIKSGINTESQLMMFSHSSWQYFPDTGRSTIAYIVIYHDGPIYHCTHITDIFYQYSALSEYNASLSVGMALSHFRMRNN